MTIDEVKLILMRAWKLKKEYEEDFERIQRLRSQLSRVTPIYSQAPGGSHSADKMTDMVSVLLELDSEYRQHMSDYFLAMKVAQDLIDSLEKQSHRRVLKLRYLDYCKWEDIADLMQYDVRHVTRLHHEALELLAEEN